MPSQLGAASSSVGPGRLHDALDAATEPQCERVLSGGHVSILKTRRAGAPYDSQACMAATFAWSSPRSSLQETT